MCLRIRAPSRSCAAWSGNTARAKVSASRRLLTQRWLDATEVLLFGAANPFAAWLSTSAVRQDPEAVRRNAYWRFFGLDLAFGTEDNRPPVYDKAIAANANFVALFEELLFELWQAMSNVRNTSGRERLRRRSDFRIAEALRFALRSRRSVSAARPRRAGGSDCPGLDRTDA